MPADGSLLPGAPRLFAAAGEQGFRQPARFEQVAGDDLTLTTNAADMLVITTPSAVDLTPGSPFMSYLAHRASDSGLNLRLVMMRDIYDQFSDGFEPGGGAGDGTGGARFEPGPAGLAFQDRDPILRGGRGCHSGHALDQVQRLAQAREPGDRLGIGGRNLFVRRIGDEMDHARCLTQPG